MSGNFGETFRVQKAVITEEKRGGHLACQVRGTGFRVGDVQVLAERVNTILANPPESVVFEFIDCPLLDSACIGQMVRLLRGMMGLGKSVFVIANDTIWDGMRTVGLETLVHRLPNVAEYWSANQAK